MSNYHVEPADKPQALADARRSSRSATTRSRASRGASCCASRSAAAMALWLLEVTGRHASASSGRTSRAASAARSRSGRSRTSRSRTPSLPIAEGFPAYFPDARAFIVLVDPARQEFVPGEDDERRRDGAQRPGPLPALPAPRLQAEPVPQELLAGVPLPRLALRPPRDQGGRRPVRPGAAEHGPLLGDGRGRRDALTSTPSKITLGPLPVALGQPGIIPPKTPTGCI